MKALSYIYFKSVLIPLCLITMALIEPVGADSIIRIIGDGANTDKDKFSDHQSQPTTDPSSSRKEGTTIRIIGDKPVPARSPINEDQNQDASPIKGISIIGDKIETVRKKTPEKTKTTAEEENFTSETAEQQLAQRLVALKAEENRKAAEKAEQENKAAEASSQTAIQLEQEQLSARMADESRKTAEKAEQERLAKEKNKQEREATEATRQTAIKLEQERNAARMAEESRKVDEERLATARKALADLLPPESGTPIQQPATTGNTTDSLTVFNNGLDNKVQNDSTSTSIPETIWNLYLSAKTNDPALGRTEARVTGSKADSDQLRSGLLPHLDSSAGIQQISQTLNNYSTDVTKYDYSSLNYNVTARLTLLSVPTIYSLSAAAAGISVELAGVAAARQNLIVKLTDSYFSLLKAQTDKQIAQGEINRLKQVLEQSQAFLKAGTGDIISVYEAQSRLDGARADLNKSESSLRLAEQKLSTVVGKPVTSIVNYLPQLPAGPDPDNIDWWVTTMEKEQPVVRQAREGITQISEQRKAAKAEYLPVLQATGGYAVSRGTADLPTAEVRQWFVGASISLPLYSGGETSAKIRRAAASEEERRHIFDETMDQQRENVKQSFFNLRYNISLIKALEQKKASAEIQLAAISKGRKIGTRNAIDLLNAEQTYSMAMRDYKFALYDNIIRTIQLKSAAGILADADVSEISKTVAPTLSSGLISYAVK